MTRFMLWGGLAIVAVGLACFYPLGEQPLIGHMAEIYRSPVVQKKVTALNTGVEKRTHDLGQDAKTWWAKATEQDTVSAKHRSRAPLSRVEPAHEVEAVTKSEPRKEPAASEKPRELADKPAPAAPAQDQLTDQDRNGLNRLLAEKLHAGR